MDKVVAAITSRIADPTMIAETARPRVSPLPRVGEDSTTGVTMMPSRIKAIR